METKSILGIDDFGIRKYEGYIDELKIWKIIDELDNYYNNKGILKTGYGEMPYEECINGRVVKIISIVPVNNNKIFPLYKYQYYDFMPIRLSLLLRKIIACNSKMKLSYLVGELYSFAAISKEEQELYDRAVNNLTFVSSSDPYSLKEKIFNFSYSDLSKSKIKQAVKKKIKKLPYIKEF